MTKQQEWLDYAKYVNKQGKLYRQYAKEIKLFAKSLGEVQTAGTGEINPPTPPPGMDVPLKPPPTP